MHSWAFLASSGVQFFKENGSVLWGKVILGDVGPRVPREGQHFGLQKNVNVLSETRPVRWLLKGLLLNATAKLGKNQGISERICVVVLFCFIVLLLLLQIIVCIPFTTLLFSCWPGTTHMYGLGPGTLRVPLQVPLKDWNIPQTSEQFFTEILDLFRQEVRPSTSVRGCGRLSFSLSLSAFSKLGEDRVSFHVVWKISKGAVVLPSLVQHGWNWPQGTHRIPLMEFWWSLSLRQFTSTQQREIWVSLELSLR